MGEPEKKHHVFGSIEIAIVAIIVGVFALGSFTLALSDYARPGDMLYKVDRAAESVQYTFTMSEESKIEFSLARVQERYDEFQSLISNDSSLEDLDLARSEYSKAMNLFLRRADLSKGDPTKHISEFKKVSEVQYKELEEMGNDAPANRRSLVDEVREVSQKGLERATGVIPENKVEKIIEKVPSDTPASKANGKK